MLIGSQRVLLSGTAQRRNSCAEFWWIMPATAKKWTRSPGRTALIYDTKISLVDQARAMSSKFVRKNCLTSWDWKDSQNSGPSRTLKK